MSAYADTSVLVSLYLPERRSADARHWIALQPSIWLTSLHVAEWTHAIELHVFRGDLSSSERSRVCQDFQRDREDGIWNEVAVSDDAYVLCAELARQYAHRFGMRTLDSLHVALALELKAEVFFTFDDRQRRLARARGLRVNGAVFVRNQ